MSRPLLRFLGLLPLLLLLLSAAQVISHGQVPLDSSVPTLFDEDSQWALLGCYNELDATKSARALVETGSFYTPATTTPDNLTVPLCLERCGAILASGEGGPYVYAGVEDSRECFCGLTLSTLSKPHDREHCSSPCPGDPTSSCGGNEYLALYILRSSILSSNTSSKRQTSPTITPFRATPSATQSYIPPIRPKYFHASTGVYIGIAFGGFVFIILMMATIFFANPWYRHRKNKAGMGNEEGCVLDDRALNEGIFNDRKAPTATSRREPSQAGRDGRRNGLVEQGESYVSPLGGVSEYVEGGKAYRQTFDIWKKGYGASLGPDDRAGPVEVGSGLEARRGTAADGPVCSESDGLDDLGLSYVDSRLAELETADRSDLEACGEQTDKSKALFRAKAVQPRILKGSAGVKKAISTVGQAETEGEKRETTVSEMRNGDWNRENLAVGQVDKGKTKDEA